MALTPRLDSVETLYAKLEREGYRAFHHRNRTHKADHFYNFCVTAHSLRDYVLDRLGKIEKTDRQPFHAIWSKNTLLTAVSDIANSAKHFQLRDGKTQKPKVPRTQGVRHGRTTIAEVWIDGDGKFFVRKRSNVPTYYVVVKGGQRFELYAFIEAVLRHWKTEIEGHGIRVRKQPLKLLMGTVT